MLVKKDNPEFNPNIPESQDNVKQIEIKDRQGINDEFHRAFQKICAKQDNVDDSSEAIQDFLDSGNDTRPSEYITNIALSDAERDKIEGEITLGELEYSLFKKMKGSSAPGIDGFTVNWLRKFWSSLKLITFNAINECYRDGSLTSSLKTGIIRLLRKGQKDPTLTGNYRPISLLLIHY